MGLCCCSGVQAIFWFPDSTSLRKKKKNRTDQPHQVLLQGKQRRRQSVRKLQPANSTPGPEQIQGNTTAAQCELGESWRARLAVCCCHHCGRLLAGCCSSHCCLASPASLLLKPLASFSSLFSTPSPYFFFFKLGHGTLGLTKGKWFNIF